MIDKSRIARAAILAGMGFLVSMAFVRSGAAASLTAEDFTSGGPDAVYGKLAALKDAAAAGKGKIVVLLPDTRSSARWATVDAPGFERAFKTMGLTPNDYIIDNAQGSPQTQQTQAEQALTQGASVVVETNLDSGSGAAIEANAKSQGVLSIDYDRLTLNGDASYYVSFDGVAVGRLLGQGLMQCVSDWHVKDAQVFELGGSPTDNNGTLFQTGYDEVLDKDYADKKATKVGEVRVPNWDNQVGETMFQQAFQAHQNINAVLAANDGLGQSVISVLKNQKTPPETVPVTGQDATLQGAQNILAGYQCMTVYKPIYEEVAAAAAIAVIARARQTPGSALANGATDNQKAKVPSVLLTPQSVTQKNMQATVIADKFIDTKELCSGGFASMCSKAGIH
jgi:D-xylose transport system substrate-binding protein